MNTAAAHRANPTDFGTQARGRSHTASLRRTYGSACNRCATGVVAVADVAVLPPAGGAPGSRDAAAVPSAPNENHDTAHRK